MFNLWLFIISLFRHFFLTEKFPSLFLSWKTKETKKERKKKEGKRIWQPSFVVASGTYQEQTKKKKKLLTSPLFLCDKKKTRVQTLWRFCFSYLGGFPKSTILHPQNMCVWGVFQQKKQCWIFSVVFCAHMFILGHLKFCSKDKTKKIRLSPTKIGA